MTYTKEEYEAFQEFLKLANEFNKLFLEAAKYCFVDLRPLDEWRTKNWKEVERLLKKAGL